MGIDNDKKKKYLYLEIMRIFAIFFVIFTHTKGFLYFSSCPNGSISFYIYSFISIFCKFAVYLFFMISGALLLNKESQSITKILKKILKYIIILLIFSLIYYLIDINNKSIKFDISYFIKMLYTGNLKYHLYFIQVYIAFLLSLPFLQKMVKNLENKYFHFMFALAILFIGVIPIIEYLFFKGNVSINSYIKPLWLFEMIVLYPCLGYYLQNKFEITKRKIIIIWIINVISILVCCYMTSYKLGITNYISTSSLTFHNSFIYINSACIFLTIKYLFENKSFSKILQRIIISLSSCTFGIYLIHVSFFEFRFGIDTLIWLEKLPINRMVISFIFSFITLLYGYSITFIIKKIPIIKKYL